MADIEQNPQAIITETEKAESQNQIALESTNEPLLSNEKITLFALDQLSNDTHGPQILELIGIRVCEIAYRKIDVFISSGNPAGGDGGSDGSFSDYRGNRHSIACSIQKSNVYHKAKSDALKAKKNQVDCFDFITNQTFKENQQRKLQAEVPGISITVFDRNKLFKYSLNDSELRKLLRLPSFGKSLTREYLKDNYQLQNDWKRSVSTSIPREVSFGTQTISLQDFAKKFITIQTSIDSEKPERPIVIIEASAGDGKTVALKQLHHEIIFCEKVFSNEIFLPPAYLDLGVYTPGNLKEMINEALCAKGDFDANNYIILADGFDEIPIAHQENFIKELGELGLNQANRRYCIISCRSGEINNVLKDYQRISLYPVTLEAFSKYCDASFKLDFSAKKEIFRYVEKHLGFESLFTISRIPIYYMKNKHMPQKSIQLLDFIAEEELKQIFRGNQIEYEQIGKLAFQMTKSQTSAVKLTADKYSHWGISKLSFSHKMIQEYFAAKWLSNLDVETIIRETSHLGIIATYFYNTVSLLLRILVFQGHTNTFSSLIALFIKKEQNFLPLMLGDSSGYSKKEIDQIITSAIECSTLEGIFDNDTFWLQLEQGLIENEKLFDTTMKKILENIEQGPQNTEYARLLRIFAYDIGKSMKAEDILRIKELLLSSVQSCNPSMEYLADSISHLSQFNNKATSVLSLSETESLIKVATENQLTDLFPAIVRIVGSQEGCISCEAFADLLSMFFLIRKGLPSVGYVPEEFTEDFKQPVFKIVVWQGFIAILPDLLKKNPEFAAVTVINILKQNDLSGYEDVLEIIGRDIDSNAQKEALLNSITPSLKEWLCKPLFLRSLNGASSDSNCDWLIEHAIGIVFLNKIEIQDKESLWSHIFKSKNSFSKFIALFNDTEEPFALIKQSLRYIPTPIRPEIRVMLPVELATEIDSIAAEMERIRKNHERIHTFPDGAIHQAFDPKELRCNIEKCISYYTSNPAFPYLQDYDKDGVIREPLPEFGLFILQEAFRSAPPDGSLLDHFFNRYKGTEICAWVLHYIMKNGVSFDEISETEWKFIHDSFKEYLKTSPLDGDSKSASNTDLTLLLYMYSNKGRQVLQSLIPSNPTKFFLMGLENCNLPPDTCRSKIQEEPKVTCIWDILQLIPTIDCDGVFTFILTFLKKTRNQLAGQIGTYGWELYFLLQYLNRTYNSFSIGQQRELRQDIILPLLIVAGITQTASDFQAPVSNQLTELAQKAKIGSHELEDNQLKEIILQAFKASDFRNTIACGLYENALIRNPDKKEVDRFVSLFLRQFDDIPETDLKKKKSFAEYFLMNNHSYNLISEWYCSYLINNKNSTIGNDLAWTFSQWYIDEIEGLSKVCELYDTYKNRKDSEKKTAIVNMVYHSFQHMASKATDDEQFKYLVKTISNLSEEFQRMRRKLETEYVDRFLLRNNQNYLLGESCNEIEL